MARALLYRNTPARVGLACSLCAIVVLPLAPIALAVSIGGVVSYRRRKGQRRERLLAASIGVVLGLLGVAFGVATLDRLLGSG